MHSRTLTQNLWTDADQKFDYPHTVKTTDVKTSSPPQLPPPTVKTCEIAWTAATHVMRSIVHCSASAFDAQFKGCRHKRRIATGSLDQRPSCNSGVKWSSLVSIHRSEQSCLLIGLPTARSHQLANTGRYCEQNDSAQRSPSGVRRRPLCSVRLLTNCCHGIL